MTTAMDRVSSAARQYAETVSGGAPGTIALDEALVRLAAGGLQPGETVDRALLVQRFQPGGGSRIGLAVLTDRAVLLADDGGERRRLSLWDLVRTDSRSIEHLGYYYPALGLAHGRAEEVLIPFLAEGWAPEPARQELQAFGHAVLAAASEAKKLPRPRNPLREDAPPSILATPWSPPPPTGGPRFAGDASPVAGIPLSRLFNAACYIIAGIAVLVISAQPDVPTFGPLLIGLALIAYGGKILLTRSSYWVSSVVYGGAFLAVAAALTALAR